MKIDRIVYLAKRYGATRLILFGSAARRPSEARDIDLAEYPVGNCSSLLQHSKLKDPAPPRRAPFPVFSKTDTIHARRGCLGTGDLFRRFPVVEGLNVFCAIQY